MIEWDSALAMQTYIRDRAFADPNSGCWLWEKQVDKDGYGQFRRSRNGPWFKAHRVSFLVFRGSIPDGMNVLHLCDTRCCVNPAHLYLGTQVENVRDMHRARYDLARKIAPSVILWHEGRNGGEKALYQVARANGLGKNLLRRVMKEAKLAVDS